MARPPLLPPRPSTGKSERGLASPEPEEEGPLWSQIKRQLYRSEVTHIKRLVGDSLIQQNRVMWDELASLRQILVDFQQQNDELSDNKRQQVMFCSSQHRDLLRRQAQIIMEDVQSQAEACGHVLEDLVPEFRNENLRDFVSKEEGKRSRSDMDGSGCKPTPPMTPSTRPSSSGGVSGCSTPDIGLPQLPLGRPLGFDELGPVAEGIREALEAEHEALLVNIGEQMQWFEAEESRRLSNVSATREPSTAELQQLVHKLQDLAVNPSLRILASTGAPGAPTPDSPAAGASDATDFLIPQPIGGGANVRRLKALIAQRRKFPTGPLPGLGAVREASFPPTPMGSTACFGSPSRGADTTPLSFGSSSPLNFGNTGLERLFDQQPQQQPREKSLGEMLGGLSTPAAAAVAKARPGFDPFFDDPFA